jgi:DNA-binding response OmpR family regulator
VLLARLRALLRRGQQPRPTILAAGDLKLDPAAKKVFRGETVIPLTAREFALAEVLMRHAGTVLSKRDILDRVWDEHFEGDPNIVEVYIRHLRTKLGRDVIETVRGAGYRLAGDGA